MEDDSCLSDTLTQSPSGASSVSGDDLSKDDENAKELGLLNHTVRFEDEFESQFDGETQQLEDADCQGFGDSDGHASDTTLVLEDDDECEVGTGDTPMSFRKRKDIVPDSDTSADKCVSGSVRSSCVSVCVASLKGSNEAACTVSKNLRDDEEMPDTRNPTPSIRFIDDARGDHIICNANMKGGSTIGVNSVVKKLSFEDTSNLNDSSLKDNESTDGAEDTSLSLAFNHQLAGLSYLNSQEPGEETQNNALDIVDKFLSLNDLKMSQEEAVPAVNETNFSLSRPKGTQELAKRINSRSPARETSIFDWPDIPEDAEVGISTSKRKRKDRDSSCKKKKEGLNLGKRIMGVARSDPSLLLDEPRGVSKSIETFESERNNNVEFDKQPDAVIQEKLPEVTGISNDVMDMYDVGFDTQMAAEAMQDLLFAPPANHDSDKSHQDPEKTIVCSPRGDPETKSCLKQDLVHKKRKPFNEKEDAAIRQCKKTKTVEAKSSNEITSRTISVKSVKTRVKQPKPASGVKPKAKDNLRPEGAYSSKKSISSVDSKKVVAEQEMGSVKGANCFNSLLESNENVSLNQSLRKFGTFTPIACRTRRSRTPKLLKGLNLSTTSEEARYMVSGISHSSEKNPNSIVKTQLPKSKKQSQQNDRYLAGHHELSDLNRDGNADDQPNVTTEEINFPFVPRRKRSKCRVIGSFNCAIKNDTGSIFIPGPSKCSAGKKFGGLADDGAVNCSMAVMNGNLVPKFFGKINSPGDYGKISEAVKSSSENAEQCSTLDGASRVCTQYYHRKKSRKKSLLRPSLAKELASLDSIEASSSPLVKDLRKRRDVANVRVLFSNHLDEDIIKHQQKISGRLGIHISSSSSEATHFVADQFARTRNMLEAIAHGKHVVTHLWLESCEQAGCLIDEKNYILRDPKKEREIGFSMPASLARARKSPLLQDKQIFVTPNVKPSRELVSDLAKAVHGQIVEEIGRFAKNSSKIPDNFLVFSCEEDQRICMPLVKKGAAIYSSEILLTGIIIQKLEYGRHRLFRD